MGSICNRLRGLFAWHGGRWECYFRIGGCGAIDRLLQPVGLRKKRTVRFAAFFAGRSRASLLVDQMKSFSSSSLFGLFSRSVPGIFWVLSLSSRDLAGFGANLLPRLETPTDPEDARSPMSVRPIDGVAAANEIG